VWRRAASQRSTPGAQSRHHRSHFGGAGPTRRGGVGMIARASGPQPSHGGDPPAMPSQARIAITSQPIAVRNADLPPWSIRTLSHRTKAGERTALPALGVPAARTSGKCGVKPSTAAPAPAGTRRQAAALVHRRIRSDQLRLRRKCTSLSESCSFAAFGRESSERAAALSTYAAAIPLMRASPLRVCSRHVSSVRASSTSSRRRANTSADP